MAAFAFELVSPEKLLFSGDVDEVVIPGTEGDFAVLKDHAPVIAALRPGVLTYTDAKGVKQALFVRGGFADVSTSGLIVLAEKAVAVADVTDDVLEAEVKLASAELTAAKTEDSRSLAAERLAQIETLRGTIRH
jgi:F-type H+-transporting ATPase subunit epsilon